MSVSNQAEEKTLGEFLLDCLKQEEVTDIFGVPGDYNFSLLDTIERYEGVRFINGVNELNAGYAADGYARLRGMGALITTFGVGEMSACNAIAGAYSENVPVIHIVGSPKLVEQNEKKLLHHTLMDGDYDVFRKTYENITAYTAVLTPENAELEIPNALYVAKQKKKPVYLVVAIDLVTKPIVRHNRNLPKPSETNEKSLNAAFSHAQQILNKAESTVILVDTKAMRYRLQAQIEQLAEKMNVPVSSLFQGKGGFDESHPLYIGMYSGAFGNDKVRNIVEDADCVITVGLVWSDVNSSKSTANLNTANMINIQPHSVKIGEALYPDVLAEDILNEIIDCGYRQDNSQYEIEFPYETMIGSPDEPLTAASYYPRFQNMLAEEDIIVVETGSFSYGMSQVRLPKGADYIVQGGWQSIGYSVPATFGACMAAGARRALLFTGDGSLQLTVQEISSMLKNGCTPIIFILNNQGFTIEKYLNVQTEDQKYNQISNWDYTKLTEVFADDAYTASVQTNNELDLAIEQAEKLNGTKLCIIELRVKDPMDAPDYLQKMRNYLEENK
ncbi:alpha-keto acid decarboxylase family protein [Peribacillus sp. SCS-155]|uniref:alpha-keto acid decarboxylase family protein n=1 Tax=Peribacillus sedimenti TaxID=3115297 RepID=UPI003905AC77